MLLLFFQAMLDVALSVLSPASDKRTRVLQKGNDIMDFFIRQPRIARLAHHIEEENPNSRIPAIRVLSEPEWQEWRALRKWIRGQRRELRTWIADPDNARWSVGDWSAEDLATWWDSIYTRFLDHMKPASRHYKTHGASTHLPLAVGDAWVLKSWDTIVDDRFTEQMAATVARALESWFPDQDDWDQRSGEIIEHLRPLAARWGYGYLAAHAQLPLEAADAS